MNRKTISIIIPNYNYSKYLKQSINSILFQARKPDQLIIIDDGSTDDSVKIIEELIKDIPFAVLLKNKTNMGIECSLNKALEFNTKDYIGFMASDDIKSHDFIYEMMKFVEENSDIAICCSLPAFFKNHKDVWADNFNTFEKKIFDPETLIDVMKSTKFWMASHTCIYQASKLNQRSFDSELRHHSDWYTVLDIAFKNKVGFIPKALAFMRVHAFAYSRQEKKYSELKKIYSALFNKIERENEVFKQKIINSRSLSALDSAMFIFLLFRLKYWKYLPTFVVGKIIRFNNRAKNKVLKLFNIKSKNVSALSIKCFEDI
ncbi:MAG: putative glycosyltransferase EpsH [Candidatus Anoxychlamydiales bacterium]|nr:putative glycosyltransferase EpsH [Candidatus Anoxychlamydiales bacterium]NGX35524.1 putative glycosyltransferase EpsH [Candidatus Anoxychlamydiales bacterium]